jgi:lysophospholipase L1-like esterase
MRVTEALHGVVDDDVLIGLAGGDVGRDRGGVRLRVLNASRADLLPRWRKALQDQAAGLRSPRVLCLGDSTMLGSYASGAGFGVNDPLSMPAKLAKQLADMGLPASYLSKMGGGQPGKANYPLMHPGAIFGGAWDLNDAFGAPGAAVFYNNGAGGDTLTLPMAGVWDEVRVYFIRGTGFGTFSVAVDAANVGGATATAAGVQSVGVATFSAAAVPHGVVKITKAAGTGTLFILGVCARDTRSSPVEVLNAGWGGSTAAQWADATNVWSPASVAAGSYLQTVGADLVVMKIGANDAAATTPAAFETSIRAQVTAIQKYSDLVLVTQNPIGEGVVSRALQLGLVQKMRDVGHQLGVPVYDGFAAWGSQELAAGRGFYPPGEVVHPFAAGYADEAAGVAALIMPI